MHARKAAVICMLVLLAGGCAAKSQPPQAATDVIMGQNAILEPGQPVHVVAAAPGQANVAAAAIFGPNVGQALVQAFTPHASHVTLDTEALTPEPALAAARKKKARYLAIPSLFSASVLSYQRTPEARMNFFYSVFDVATGAHLVMREMTVTTGGLDFAIGPSALQTALDTSVAGLFGR